MTDNNKKMKLKSNWKTAVGKGTAHTDIGNITKSFIADAKGLKKKMGLENPFDSDPSKRFEISWDNTEVRRCRLNTSG